MRAPNIAFDYMNNMTLIKKVIYYITDSQYRTIVKLSDTLSNQLISPPEEMSQLAKEIVKGVAEDDYDLKIFKILRWIRSNITYNYDSKTYGMSEKWATVEEILTRWYVKDGSKIVLSHVGWTKMNDAEFRSDDCDGGNSLIYILGRLAGIPLNRLLIACGDTTLGAHYYCLYRPQDLPWNVVTMDFCFCYDSKTVEYRPKYFLFNNSLHRMDGKPNNYKEAWWFFNEENSFETAKLPWS